MMILDSGLLFWGHLQISGGPRQDSNASIIFCINISLVFEKNHGTNLTLIEVIDSIYRSLDSGKIVCGVFLDLQKAFDTVQHNILLHKLFNCSVRGIVQNWFHSYLNQRCHHTVIGKVNSPMSYVIVEYHKALYLVHFCF